MRIALNLSAAIVMTAFGSCVVYSKNRAFTQEEINLIAAMRQGYSLFKKEEFSQEMKDIKEKIQENPKDISAEKLVYDLGLRCYSRSISWQLFVDEQKRSFDGEVRYGWELEAFKKGADDCQAFVVAWDDLVQKMKEKRKQWKMKNKSQV